MFLFKFILRFLLSKGRQFRSSCSNYIHFIHRFFLLQDLWFSTRRQVQYLYIYIHKRSSSGSSHLTFLLSYKLCIPFTQIFEIFLSLFKNEVRITISKMLSGLKCIEYTVYTGSSDPFYIVTYYIKWVTTSWTYSTRIGQK